MSTAKTPSRAPYLFSRAENAALVDGVVVAGVVVGLGAVVPAASGAEADTDAGSVPLPPCPPAVQPVSSTAATSALAAIALPRRLTRAPAARTGIPCPARSRSSAAAPAPARASCAAAPGTAGGTRCRGVWFGPHTWVSMASRVMSLPGFCTRSSSSRHSVGVSRIDPPSGVVRTTRVRGEVDRDVAEAHGRGCRAPRRRRRVRARMRASSSSIAKGFVT